jgi:single-stranded DNA-binding protein
MQAPQLRITPAGSALLRLVVDCGEPGGALALAIVMTGEAARLVAPRLHSGELVRVTGTLRAVKGRGGSGIVQMGIEVVAEEITPAGESSEGPESAA